MTPVTPTVTPTWTDVPPGSSYTITPSISPTASASPSSLPSGTATVTPTASASQTPSCTVTPPPPGSSFTVTPTSSATPLAVTPPLVATAVPGEGLSVEKLVCSPNPNLITGLDQSFHVLVKGRCETVVVRLYTPARTGIAELRIPAAGTGWLHAQVPASAFPANGTYHAMVWAEAGGRRSNHKLCSVVIVR